MPVCAQIEDFNMVQFLPLDVTDEDSVGVVLSHLDNAIQYGEHEEPKEPADVSSGRGCPPCVPPPPPRRVLCAAGCSCVPGM